MTDAPLILAILVCILLLAGGGGATILLMRRERRLSARVTALHTPPGRLTRQPTSGFADEVRSLRTVVLGFVAKIGQSILSRGLLSRRTLNELEQSLRAGGQFRAGSLGLFVGSKIMLAAGLPVVLFGLTREFSLPHIATLLLPAAGAVIGLLMPDFVLRQLRSRHNRRVALELPDALDMMVICAQAGLGLGPTIVRVATELHLSHKAIAYELAQTADELQMSTDTQGALAALGQRSGVDGLKRLAATLLQSAQYGTPLTQALRTLSAELRHEVVTRYEARAARLPVLLTLPMVAFILPTLFLIVGGPAVIHLIRALSHSK